MPESILDISSVHGLLRMAGEEGLLRDRQDKGDRFLYGLQQRTLPDWHRQQILEQIVINSRIHTVGRIPFDWLEGDFLDLDLVNVVEQDIDWSEEGQAIAPEVIEGMLRARGYELSFDDWVPIFERSKAVFEEVTKFEANHPDAKIDAWSTIARGVVDKDFRNTEQYALSKKWNKAYGEVRPLMLTIEEFLKLSEYATTSTHYLRTPVYRPSPNLINLSADSPADSPVVHIYRITTRAMGVMSIFDTLRNTIEIARDKDAISLREQIDYWLDSLERDSADLMTRIQEEIRSASSSLAKAKALKMGGTIMGYISIPISVLSLVQPLFGAIGLTLTCVAVICDRSGKMMENRVRWVGFGTIRRNG